MKKKKKKLLATLTGARCSGDQSYDWLAWVRQQVGSGARCLGPIAMAVWGRQQGGSGARCLGPVAMAVWGRQQVGSGARCLGDQCYGSLGKTA